MPYTRLNKGLMLSAILLSSVCHQAIGATTTKPEIPAPAEVTMPQSFTICTDTNFQFPFSFMKNEHPVGLHIDVIDAALKSLGVTPRYEPTTWSSCLNRAKAGMVDAVATAAYMDERALYMYYPVDATNDSKSSWRITQVEYKVITSLLTSEGDPNTYQFNGDTANIPQPVRVPAGYFIVHDLQKARLNVKEGQTSLENFQSLLKDRTGSVVDLAEVAQHFSAEPAFANQFHIQNEPLVVKSYYLAFSKSGHLSLPQAQRVWDAIAKVRDDKALMAAFLKKY